GAGGAAGPRVRGRNPRRGPDRPGERPPARLVAARHRPDPALQRGPLATEGRADIVLAQRQTDDRGGGAATHGAMVRARSRKSTVAACRRRTSHRYPSARGLSSPTGALEATELSEQAQLVRAPPR